MGLPDDNLCWMGRILIVGRETNIGDTGKTRNGNGENLSSGCIRLHSKSFGEGDRVHVPSSDFRVPRPHGLEEIHGPLLHQSMVDHFCYVLWVAKFGQVIRSTESIDKVHDGYRARLTSNCAVHDRWHAKPFQHFVRRILYAAFCMMHFARRILYAAFCTGWFMCSFARKRVGYLNAALRS